MAVIVEIAGGNQNVVLAKLVPMLSWAPGRVMGSWGLAGK